MQSKMLILTLFFFLSACSNNSDSKKDEGQPATKQNESESDFLKNTTDYSVCDQPGDGNILKTWEISYHTQAKIETTGPQEDAGKKYEGAWKIKVQLSENDIAKFQYECTDENNEKYLAIFQGTYSISGPDKMAYKINQVVQNYSANKSILCQPLELHNDDPEHTVSYTYSMKGACLDLVTNDDNQIKHLTLVPSK